jgi:hypothetical protein
MPVFCSSSAARANHVSQCLVVEAHAGILTLFSLLSGCENLTAIIPPNRKYAALACPHCGPQTTSAV